MRWWILNNWNVTRCTGDPRNDQFFRWILLVVSHCKITDTVRHRLHSALWLLEEHYGVFFCEFYFHIFSHVRFKGVTNKRPLHLPRPPRCRYRTSNCCSLFFEFVSHYKALMITQEICFNKKILSYKPRPLLRLQICPNWVGICVKVAQLVAQ